MNSESSELEKFQKIQEEHRQLTSLLEQIESALAERSGPISDVVDLIGQLGHQLTKHFQTEEAGGYFAEALYDAPRLFDRANDLMLQHPKMTKSARKLAEAADPDVEPDRWWEQTAQRFEAFRAELRNHEREEDRLIQEAFTRDIGSHD
jgi:hemerythrin